MSQNILHTADAATETLSTARRQVLRGLGAAATAASLHFLFFSICLLAIPKTA